MPGGPPLTVITNTERGPLASPGKLLPTARDCRGTPRPAGSARSAKKLRCFLRVRPPADGPDAAECLQIRSGTEVTVRGRRGAEPLSEGEGSDSETGSARTFAFDAVFGPSADQQQVYTQVAKQTVQDVFEGYHGLIFAYGQTGTGKTYTLCNHAAGREGLLVRAVQEVFATAEALPDADRCQVSMQMLQLYQEVFQDLLVPDAGPVQLRDDPILENGVELAGAACMALGSAEECLAWYRAADQRRATAATLLNEHSSRSHTLFILNVVRPNVDGRGTDVKGRLILVDLAGSERQRKAGSSGQRLAEAKHINTSLLVLGRVIHGLAEPGTPHVPYRDSKLTRFLQYALSGNGKTTIIVTVSPAAAHAEETASAIRFGQRAMQVEHHAKAHREVDYHRLALQLQAELNALHEGLALSGSGGGAAPAALQQRAEELEDAVRRLIAANAELAGQRDAAVARHTALLMESEVLDQEVRTLSNENKQLQASLQTSVQYCNVLCDRLDAPEAHQLRTYCDALEAQLADSTQHLRVATEERGLLSQTVGDAWQELQGWALDLVLEEEGRARRNLKCWEEAARKAQLNGFLAADLQAETVALRHATVLHAGEEEGRLQGEWAALEAAEGELERRWAEVTAQEAALEDRAAALTAEDVACKSRLWAAEQERATRQVELERWEARLAVQEEEGRGRLQVLQERETAVHVRDALQAAEVRGLAQRQAVVTALEARLHAQQAALDLAFAEQTAALEQRQATLLGQERAVQAAVDRLQRTVLASDSQLSARESCVESAASALSDRLQELDTREAQLSAREQKLQTEAKKVRSRSQSDRVGHLAETSLRARERTMTELEEALAARGRALSAQELALRDRQREVTARERAVAAKAQAAAALQREAEDLRAQLAEAPPGPRASDQRRLQDAVQEAERRAAEAEEEAADVTRQLEELHAEYVALQGTFDEACRGLMKAERQQQLVDSLSQQLQDATARVQQLEEAHAVAQQQQQELEQLLDEAQREAQHWREESAALALTVADLQGQVAELEAQLRATGD
eukprot:EG_transcript_1737